MKAFVIGGNGFIGSHLVDALLTSGWSVTVLDVNRRQFDPIPSGVRFIRGDISQYFLAREYAIGADIVFHLAWPGTPETSIRNPIADIESGLIPSVRLLESCRIEGIKRMVFLSSGGTVYGISEKLPIAVDHPKNPVTSYGITKLAVEGYLGMYSHLHGLDYAVLRPSVPFGPRQNPLGYQGAPTVFLYRVAYGLPITIWGDGEITRDYFYVEDLVRAMIAAATYPLGAQRVFNVGGKEAISLNRLLQEVESVVGRSAKVHYTEPRPFDAPHIKLDTRLTEKYLRWKPQYSLTEGLVKTWEWIKEVVPKPDTNSTRS
ncbi:MAG: NAD-dependent epimerase/dehydratase family protein [Anaerolineae bacterium]